MVGIFSRFSVRGSHRRTQSALSLDVQDEREVLPPSTEATATAGLAAAASAATHGIEIAVEFKPVERPTEPLDNDQPIQCPLPEPSILNFDVLEVQAITSIWTHSSSVVVERRAMKIAFYGMDGRIWKERVSSGVQRRADMPIMQEQTPAAEPETIGRKPRPPTNRVILPSISAPEHNILKLLDECNASGI
ncbi:hypothetical protein Sango_2254100 [Sesamum angolense]|uniref:Uncharacterized protein n=1 Tax=Sesamum angolense TaxID=2727404 RepID=A0AAE1W9D3_9LAMI|nr:hypothetical protein Sango_2254100 [Sesamum angolense]